jgi:hypothetical protein
MLDAEAAGTLFPLSERFERGVTLAASILAHLNALQAETRVIIGGKAGRFGVGPLHLIEMLRLLAIAEPVQSNNGNKNESLSTPNPADEAGSGKIIVISAFPEDFDELVVNPSVKVIEY